MNRQWLSRIGRLAASLVLAALCGGTSMLARAADDRVVVLTSYPEELVARYQMAFERSHPGMRVEILWRQSADALAYLRRGGAHEVDVYWTPSPGNFAALRDEGRLARLQLDHSDLPSDIAGSPISDPDGRYAAFELAGYGIAYNAEAVKRLGLPAPVDWADLAAPAYAHQVQLPIPGRVGFAPVLIEAVLQAYGWQRGWAVLSEIAGNTDFGAGDSTPGADDIVTGAKAARMTIDFFAATAIAGGAPVRFAYPRKTAYNPAQIAVLAEAPHPAAAQAFVDFALSAEGQALLMHPDVRRLPVRRSLYTAHPELPAQPFAPGNLAYDGALTRARQGLVASLFEAALVKRHAELAELWQTLHQAEAGGRRNDPQLAAARAALSAVPVDEAAQAGAELRRLFAFPDRVPVPRDAKTAVDTPNPQRVAVEDRWTADLDACIAAARSALAALKH